MKDASQLKLVPLRIPGGWSVKFNMFREVDPILDDGIFVNSDEFDQDLLSIERIIPEGSDWPKFICDLGWYPAEDIDGTYRLTLISGSFDKKLKTYETRSRNNVRETIEEWLDILSAHYYDENAIALL